VGRRPKFSQEVKVEIVERYLRGERRGLLIQTYGFHESCLRDWVKKYQLSGIAGLVPRGNPQSYSHEFKNQVIEAYLSGIGSEHDVAVRYGIPSRSTVSRWIRQYNSHEDISKSYYGGQVRMTKGRKTTMAERIEIAEYCLNHELNYARTAEQFQVSYQQVYSWVKNYSERGVSGLRDNRGKRKSPEDMSELERLREENRLLQMENDVLKKLAELEGRRS